MALISLMGFPPISSTLQTFQICIFNTKNSKLTFANGSQLMGKRFIANLHASLNCTCKSRISKISTRCQNWGVHSTIFDTELRNEFKNFSNPGEGPFHNLWSWTQKLKFGIDIFYGVSSNIECITDISNLHFQYKK